MAKTATAEQQARQRTREWRTKLAADLAEQDHRVSAAVATVLGGQNKLKAAGGALAKAQAEHARAVEATAAETSTAVRALKGEGLNAEQIAELTDLPVADVRRALKSDPAKAG